MWKYDVKNRQIALQTGNYFNPSLIKLKIKISLNEYICTLIFSVIVILAWSVCEVCWHFLKHALRRVYQLLGRQWTPMFSHWDKYFRDIDPGFILSLLEIIGKHVLSISEWALLYHALLWLWWTDFKLLLLTPWRRFKSFRQNSDIQIILIGVLTRVSMRNLFFYYLELFREISNTQLENDIFYFFYINREIWMTERLF